MEIVAWIMVDPIFRTAKKAYRIEKENNELFDRVCLDLKQSYNLDVNYTYRVDYIRDGHSSQLEKKVIFDNGNEWWYELASNLGCFISKPDIKKFVKISKPIYDIDNKVILFLLEPNKSARILDFNKKKDLITLCAVYEDYYCATIEEANNNNIPVYTCYNSKSFILLN